MMDSNPAGIRFVVVTNKIDIQFRTNNLDNQIIGHINYDCHHSRGDDQIPGRWPSV